MNVDQLLAIVEDLSMFTTTERLEDGLGQCRTAYDQLQGSEELSDKAKMLVAASARIENKIPLFTSPKGGKPNVL